MDSDHRRWSHPGTPLLERTATLPPDPQSPRSARRILRDLVTATGHEEWLDSGELALSEVVTNAVLHAHTAILLWLGVYPDRICVEVRDSNPTLPLARHYDVQASTGRGLGLVASLSLECGAHSLGAEGKVIWFCIGDPQEHTVDDLLEAWGREEPPVEELPPEPANVVLLDMPATLWLSARQHHDAILRELTLYGAEHRVDADLTAADLARRSISDALMVKLEEAEASGLTRPALPTGHPSPLPWVVDDLDLELRVPVDGAPGFIALQDALDLAERLAVSGRLLIHPALPEIIAVRDWACEQVISQLAGSPAMAWPGTAQHRFETDSHARFESAALEWDPTVARDSERGVVAADEANRIVAVSRPLADLLGWAVDELVGRRVVTLIPPALREAHVAGFTRHLSTGEAHILGVPIVLPVLHADGREIVCSFLVERAAPAPGPAGPAIYLAWIEPLRP